MCAYDNVARWHKKMQVQMLCPCFCSFVGQGLIQGWGSRWNDVVSSSPSSTTYHVFVFLILLYSTGNN